MKKDYLVTSRKYKSYHYSVLKPEQLVYMHDTLLKIFKEIKAVLDNENIPYIIVGGTLLGAITTGKFIPWDDDLDVCIFEEDYEKTISLLIKRLPDWILVQCEETEPNYFHGWVKVRDRNSCVFPPTKTYSCNGVWVDLYCIKRIKRKTVEIETIKEHIDYLRRRYESGDISEDEMKRRLGDNKLVERLRLETIHMNESTDTSDVYQIQSASRVSMDVSWVFPLKKIFFEDMEVLTINMPEKYLIQHYGENYMFLPCDELRRISICDLKYDI